MRHINSDLGQGNETKFNIAANLGILLKLNINNGAGTDGIHSQVSLELTSELVLLWLVFGWGPKDPISPSLAYYNCIGYHFATESYSSCAVLCSLFVLVTAYLSDCVTAVAAQSHQPSLRSAGTSNYTFYWHLYIVYTKFGERAFLHAGPASQIRCALHPALPYLNDASKYICLRLLLILRLINLCLARFWKFFFG